LLQTFRKRILLDLKLDAELHHALLHPMPCHWNGIGIGSGQYNVHNGYVYLCFVEDETDHDLGLPVDPELLIPQVRLAHKYPNSPWEMSHPPGGDNAVCM
jgi:hypothetical protein